MTGPNPVPNKQKIANAAAKVEKVANKVGRASQTVSKASFATKGIAQHVQARTLQEKARQHMNRAGGSQPMDLTGGKQRFNTSVPKEQMASPEQRTNVHRYQDHLSNFRNPPQPPPPAAVGAKPPSNPSKPPMLARR